MKIVYHPSYCGVYAMDPAAEAGRIEAIRDALEGRYPFLEPDAASEEDLLRVHDRLHLESVRADRYLYETAALAAGGAVLAARTALAGEPCFGLIRPPGHHAGRGGCWGFCYFNNLAVSLEALLAEGAVAGALVLDFDLHYGDGTDGIYRGDRRVRYLHPEERTAPAFLARVESELLQSGGYDILAISAGFDRGKADWGDLLGPEDYRHMGSLCRAYALEQCRGRRYALLEGGYNHGVLGRHVLAFLEGLE